MNQSASWHLISPQSKLGFEWLTTVVYLCYHLFSPQSKLGLEWLTTVMYLCYHLFSSLKLHPQCIKVISDICLKSNVADKKKIRNRPACHFHEGFSFFSKSKKTPLHNISTTQSSHFCVVNKFPTFVLHGYLEKNVNICDSALLHVRN